MPHNLYSSVENLRRAADDELPEPLQRYDFTGWAEVPEAGLLIRYGRIYAVRYHYAKADTNVTYSKVLRAVAPRRSRNQRNHPGIQHHHPVCPNQGH